MICFDGDVMEGIGCEVVFVVGYFGFVNFCWIYDDNLIMIEGNIELVFMENVGECFEVFGWNVVMVEDVNDFEFIDLVFIFF